MRGEKQYMGRGITSRHGAKLPARGELRMAEMLAGQREIPRASVGALPINPPPSYSEGSPTHEWLRWRLNPTGDEYSRHRSHCPPFFYLGGACDFLSATVVVARIGGQGERGEPGSYSL